MTFFEYSLPGELMATDLYVTIHSREKTRNYIESIVLELTEQMRIFESTYSRFIPNNYLYEFNNSTEFDVSPEFLEILLECKKYYEKTSGIFDPTIHDVLMNEGYNISKNLGFYSGEVNYIPTETNYSFSDIEFKSGNTVSKPADLHIDLGGIGKSYLANKISNVLCNEFNNFCLSIGGDIYIRGVDLQNKYDFWAIDLELPSEDLDPVTFICSDVGVATSGVYKRNWKKDETLKNHIIDPRSKRSTSSSIVSSTVISDDIVFSDVLAKVLLILDVEKAYNLFVNENLASVLITKDNKVILSPEMEKYVWKS